jgi:hypothetical protein
VSEKPKPDEEEIDSSETNGLDTLEKLLRRADEMQKKVKEENSDERTPRDK